MTVCGVYIGTRIVQGLPFIRIYADELIRIVRNGKNVSYDERMDKAMGKDYYIVRQIRMVTPENSTICFLKGETMVNTMQAAYFLYPRTLKIIQAVGGEPCNYLFMDEKLPDFDLAVKGVIFFGTDIKSKPERIESRRFIHNQPANTGRFGLLEL